MPEIGGVEYDQEGYDHMRRLNDLIEATPPGEERLRLAREAAHIHAWYTEFPGVRMIGAVFDEAASRAAKLEGMGRVERGADEDWKRRANEALRALCREQEIFTADNVWQRIEKPEEPRALGPVMSAAVKAGWCEPTGRVLQSKIPVHHQAPVREYRSLLYDGIPY
jgi:hypothetical protein